MFATGLGWAGLVRCISSFFLTFYHIELQPHPLCFRCSELESAALIYQHGDLLLPLFSFFSYGMVIKVVATGFFFLNTFLAT